MSQSYGWAFAQLTLDEQRRRLDLRTARPCRPCAGRGVRWRVLAWRGRRECRVCHGRGMVGG